MAHLQKIHNHPSPHIVCHPVYVGRNNQRALRRMNLPELALSIQLRDDVHHICNARGNP